MHRANMTSRTVFKLGLVACAAALALPAIAAAENYDGYCYQKKHDADGASANVSAQGGQERVKCYNGAYYAYQGNYFDAPPPPQGYSVVYFQSRPSQDHYDMVETQRTGYTKDSEHTFGWYDSEGYFHRDLR